MPGAKRISGDVARMALPLATLLSQTLVAFTIEFDNEFERQMPHRTTNHGATSRGDRGPWLVSMAMWFNCMRFVGEGGVRVGELENLARTATNWNGMERWGYIVVAPDPDDRRAKPPRREWVVRAKPKGRMAREIWAALFDAIEKRWRDRFGEGEFAGLRRSLWDVVRQIDAELPECMPILGYGLISRGPMLERRAAASAGRDVDGARDSQLPALLTKVLLAFAIEFEGESELSLAICANVLRVLDAEGVRVRDVPLRAGVSKEAISVAANFLLKRGYVEVEADPKASRTKLMRLTAKGVKAREAYRQLLEAIENRWKARFGEDAIRALRESLERLVVGEANAERSPLFGGLDPHPDGWRASVPKRVTLPHYPMVLHRGGFPDGS